MATPERSIIFFRLSERSEKSIPGSFPLTRRSTFFLQAENNTAVASRVEPSASLESLASSPVISEERYSGHGDRQSSYLEAYEKVCEECDRYYAAHSEKDKNGYLNYKKSEIVNTGKNRERGYVMTVASKFEDVQSTVRAMLNEIDSNPYKVPSNVQDKYFENSSSRLKKVWDASKIVCEYFRNNERFSYEEFSSANKHLQDFAFNYHPNAPMGPEAKAIEYIKRPPTTASQTPCVLDDEEENASSSPRPGCTIC